MFLGVLLEENPAMEPTNSLRVRVETNGHEFQGASKVLGHQTPMPDTPCPPSKAVVASIC